MINSLRTPVLTFFITIVCLPYGVWANDWHLTNTDRSDLSAEFQQFNNQVKSSYRHFSQNNEKQFAQKILQDWRVFNAALINSTQKQIKPKQQPIIQTEAALNRAKSVIIKKNNEHQQLPEGSFYGHVISMPKPNKKIKEYLGTTPAQILDFRAQLIASPSFQKLLDLFQHNSQVLTKDDWAKIKLAEYLCSESFNKHNSRTLCIWTLLHAANKDAYLAQVKQSLFLLVQSKQVWLEHPYFNVNGKNLYVFNKAKYLTTPQDDIFLQPASYTQTAKAIRILPSTGLKTTNQVLVNRAIPSVQPLDSAEETQEKSSRKTIQLDLYHVSYLQTLPMLAISHYLQDQIPGYLWSQLQPEFQNAIDPTSSNSENTVTPVLRWLQNLPYQTDLEQFGYEKPMTLTEVLYFQASDCEDRVYGLKAILATLNINLVAALQYPNHLSAAVNLNGQWYEVDPTYKGAGIGQSQPAFKDIAPTWHH